MNTLARFFIIFCLVLRSISTNSNGDEPSKEGIAPLEQYKLIKQEKLNYNKSQTAENSRSFTNNDDDVENYSANENGKQDQHEAFQRKAKPLRNIFMGIYKNYKSTYLGNRTSSEYRMSMRDRITAPKFEQQEEPIVENDDSITMFENSEPLLSPMLEEQTIEISNSEGTTQKVNKKKKKKKRRKNRTKKNKKKNKATVIPKPPQGGDDPLIFSHDGEHRYNMGPGVNVSLDMNNDIVSVNLDEDSLKEVFLAPWSDQSEEGKFL